MEKTLNQNELLTEAQQQQKALRTIGHWMRAAMVVSSCGVVLAWWGLTGAGGRFALGVTGAVLTFLGIVCAVITGLGLHNGRHNVERILKAAEQNG